eukprot:TRINITY_DN74701_c0_g1_i1.p2 TRINITY_DN74701_c0_g1~~TRINITY_DN74701_c0_g1_i1.p2  ORF type:complete len:211 (+),score=84.79 TRINITY_DN74701_c0_g1_i1:60-635(+)
MPPQVTWAQRPEFVIVTVQVVDATDVEVKFEDKSMSFKGKVGELQHDFTLPLSNEIKVEDSTWVNTQREVQIKMSKKEEGPYWDTLTAKKFNFVKVDWSRWKDEDELDGQDNLGDYGQGGMPGMPGGMGGMGGMPGMGGMDMAQMMAQMGGGAGGMPDMSALMGGMGGAGGMPGMPEGEGDSDDEEPEKAD